MAEENPRVVGFFLSRLDIPLKDKIMEFLPGTMIDELENQDMSTIPMGDEVFNQLYESFFNNPDIDARVSKMDKTPSAGPHGDLGFGLSVPDETTMILNDSESIPPLDRSSDSLLDSDELAVTSDDDDDDFDSFEALLEEVDDDSDTVGV